MVTIESEASAGGTSAKDPFTDKARQRGQQEENEATVHALWPHPASGDGRGDDAPRHRDGQHDEVRAEEAGPQRRRVGQQSARDGPAEHDGRVDVEGSNDPDEQPTCGGEPGEPTTDDEDGSGDDDVEGE